MEKKLIKYIVTLTAMRGQLESKLTITAEDFGAAYLEAAEELAKARQTTPDYRIMSIRERAN